MSETPAEVPTNPPAPVAATAPAQEPIDWTAEARKWEARAKENKSAADELAALKAAQMTEAQKLTARAEAAEAKAAKVEAEALRLRVASKHGITGDYLDLLNGSDEAALETAAQKLASLITKEQPTRKGAVGPYVPAEGATPGAGGQTPGDEFAAFLNDQLKH